MKKKNLVSIIMNCHNGEKFLYESILSVVKQTYKNWELIFFDNNSNDNSKNIVFSFKDKRIKYYKSKLVNLGIARKRAFKLCTGRFLTFLDCDDYWDKNKLKLQLNTMIKYPNVGLCFSNSIFFRKNFKRKLYNHKPNDGYIFESLLRRYFISFDTVFIDMNIIKKLKHGFDEKFTITHDLDLIIRLSMITEFKYIDKVLSYWRIHEQSFSKNKISLINFEKEIFLEKLKKILSKNKNKEYLLNLFKENINETVLEENFLRGNKKKIVENIFKHKNLNARNIFLLTLLHIPGGKKIYLKLKKS